MSTVVDEHPTAPERDPGGDQQAREDGSAGPPATGPGEATATHPCPNCGAPMEPGQEWCLQCGAAAPGALERAPWRSTGLIVAVIAALALGAAAAAVAALDQNSPAPRTVTSIVASAPVTTPPAATTTPTPSPTPTPPPATTKAAPLPSTPAKLPKIPTTTTSTTPLPTSTGSSTTGTGTGANGESQGSAGSGSQATGSGEGSGGSTEPAALLLDTDAASTYNPYNLPASYFGDPSLTIDGDNGTSWTAQVDPTTAPSMAEGVLIDLKALKKLSALELVSTSKGMVVQVYGTTETKPPVSITEAAWVALSRPLAIKKAHTHFKLLKPKQGFRYVVVWISKAPASAIGTPTAPGHVKVGEVELFPAK
ncbi:MAG TPA: zinc ribbon domain-containing protein [Solirubrobacteraceae bacterium]|nr:zinc ribbon domain-containing protein [Solirubrobacteraceae bacterium]